MLGNSLFPFLTPNSHLVSRANARGKQPQITQCCEPLQERQRAPGRWRPQLPRTCPPARALSRWLSCCRALLLHGKGISQRASVTRRRRTRGKFTTSACTGAPRRLACIWGHHLPSPLNPQAAASWGPPWDGTSTPRGLDHCPPSHLPLHTHFCTAPRGGYRATKSLSRLPRITPVRGCESPLPSQIGRAHV